MVNIHYVFSWNGAFIKISILYKNNFRQITQKEEEKMVCAVTALLGYTIGSVIGLLILNEYEKYSYICFIDRDYKEKVNFVKWLFYRICNRINETF